MANQTCSECGHTYDPDTVTIANPIPDNTCSECGTALTDDEIAALVANHPNP